MKIFKNFILFYKDDNGIFFGKRTNAMVLWFGLYAFICLGIKIYQMIYEQTIK